MCKTILLVAVFLHALPAFGQEPELNANQRLVLACHQLDVSAVVRLLRSGADVNARFGSKDVKQFFQDPWFGGWPVEASQWTPLQALAHSSAYPPPKRNFENTVEHLDWARTEQEKIPKTEIAIRSERQVQVTNILLSHGCELNAADDRGATALYCSIYAKHERMVLTLLDYSPEVNTKTGLYIDGTYNTTPLHRAYWSAKITNRLMELGANDNARDSDGNTPKQWRER